MSDWIGVQTLKLVWAGILVGLVTTSGAIQAGDGSETGTALEKLLADLEVLEVAPENARRFVEEGGPLVLQPEWDLDSPEIHHFESKIRPVLLETCFKCHGGDKTGGNLRLDTRESLLEGGDSGPVIDLSDPGKSLLLRAISYQDDDLQMPPKEKLPEESIAEFTRWLEAGAPWPSDIPDSASTLEKGKSHWAFQPVKKVEIPEDSSGWSTNAIDRFVRSSLEERGLEPAEMAKAHVLVRRLYYDLIGLPPTAHELEEFLNDSSPDPYSKLVDRLLDSPHYGERWGRHWMDVVRYADTAGDSADYPVPELRYYRDYIIDSFNEDKPYDQFVKEQIAGDLLAEEGPDDQYAEKVIATGFIALSRRFGTLPYQTMHEVIEDSINTTGRTFMGLTLKCARCHDHKFDPISIEDYYGLYGFFSSTEYPYAGSETSISQGNTRRNFVPLSREKSVKEKIGAYNKQVDELRTVLKYLEKEAPIKEEIKKYESQVKSLEKAIQIAEESEGFEGEPLKGFLEIAKKNRNDSRKLYGKKVREKKDQLSEVGFRGFPPEVDGAYAVRDKPNPTDVHVQKKGEPNNNGDLVPRGVPAALRFVESLEVPPGKSGRLQLAEWLAHEDHPLTARVMVNRIWQHHFGKGIVKSTSNFGVMGDDPTHPELLDWLAMAFVESGWSIKDMHRLIVHSKTYRMSSEFHSENTEIDPNNSFYWRYPSRRLDAESIRDSMLAASGLLDRGRGKNHPFPPMNKWRYTQHAPFQDIYPSVQRSVYLMVPRFQRHPYLGLFDGPDPNRTTGSRPESTVPLQALFFMNNDFVHELCAGFGKRLVESGEGTEGRIDFAYRTTLSRSPTGAEIKMALTYLDEYQKKLADEEVPEEDRPILAWGSLGRVLFSSNEFFYLD